MRKNLLPEKPTPATEFTSCTTNHDCFSEAHEPPSHPLNWPSMAWRDPEGSAVEPTHFSQAKKEFQGSHGGSWLQSQLFRPEAGGWRFKACLDYIASSALLLLIPWKQQTTPSTVLRGLSPLRFPSSRTCLPHSPTFIWTLYFRVGHRWHILQLLLAQKR